MNFEALAHYLYLLAGMDPVVWWVMSINLLLVIFAKPMVRLVYHEDEHTDSFKRRLRVFRALNFLIMIVFGYFHFYMLTAEKGLGLKLLAILVTFYLGYLASHFANFLIIRRYGKHREIKGEARRVETYNTRLLNIFAQVFIFIMVLITVVRLLGFDTLLEAGGVIGFVGVFLALTNGVWAPDIFSGLIILNSDMLEEGDVIEFEDGSKIYGMVYKTKVFHTEILDLVNNHRIMIKNARLREYTVHNLSKFASAKGLKANLCFKIGYDVSPQKVRKMLQAACEKAYEDNDIEVDRHHPFEIAVNDTGDHAVEWIVFYYTKDTERLPVLRRRLLAVFLDASIEADISLATPLTHQLTGHSAPVQLDTIE